MTTPDFRVIIAGSRDIGEGDQCGAVVQRLGSIFDACLPGAERVEIISGGCRGVDRCGEILAERRGFALRIFPADWDTHGKKAGPIRNQQMIDYAAEVQRGSAVIVIRYLDSKGSADLLWRAHGTLRLVNDTRIMRP